MYPTNNNDDKYTTISTHPNQANLPTLQNLLRRIHNLLNLAPALLNNLLHRRPGLLQLIRPRSLPHLHRPQLLLLLRPRILDNHPGLLARLGRLGHSRLSRIRRRRRDVDHQQQRVGPGRIRLRRERQGGALDGGGDGFDVLFLADEDLHAAAFGDDLRDVAQADFLGVVLVGLDAQVLEEFWVEAAAGAEFAEVVF